MSESSVLISYFDPFDTFENVRSQFMQLIPFQNVHWKTPSGTIRTVESLPVSFVAEDASNSKYGIHSASPPFIRLLVVSCKSVDEYRAKVRPLVKQWLSTTVDEDGTAMSSTPMIFLYANSEVVDSNLFKSVSLLEKFTKDFPTTKTLEIKSVYKSPKEKEEFWLQFANQLKNSILYNFQERLNDHDRKLKESSDFYEQLLLREKLMSLYLSFKINEEANTHLNEIRESVMKKDKNDLPKGELELDFKITFATEPESIVEMLKNNTLNKFKLYKYFFIQKYKLILTNPNKNQQCIDIFGLIRSFLHCMDGCFKNFPNLLEFEYSFLMSVINILPTTDVKDSTISMEVAAELLLLARDIWIHGVAISSNMYILGKSNWKNDKVAYTFNIVKDSYENEIVFQDNFLSKTKRILSLFNTASGTRQRIVDILSIEIGQLHYQKGEYEKAVTIFMSCYEYYTQSNWDIIGLNILKIFVDSLSKCPELKTLKIEDEDVPVSTALSNAYLNIIKLIDDMDEKKIWWMKFLVIQDLTPTDLVHTLDNLFEINITKFVFQPDINTYGINVSIRNQGFPEDITVDTITLTLRNNEGEFITFHEKNKTISKDLKTLTLKCTNVIYGSFTLVSFEINLKDITFLREFDEDQESIQIVQMYNTSNFSVDICHSKKLVLGSNHLNIILQNKAILDMLSVKVSVEPINGKFPISFSKDTLSTTLSLGTNDSFENICYYYKEQTKSFFLKIYTVFKKEGFDTIYSESKLIEIEAYLPVSVSIEEIFKKEFVCFKFHLNSSLKSEPVFLHSSNLNPPEEKTSFTIYGDFVPHSPVLLSDDINNSCLNSYIIRTNEQFNEEDVFTLHVQYNLCKEQLDQLVTDAILVQGDIQWYEKFELWKIYWKNYILPKLKYDYTKFEICNIILIKPHCLDIKQLTLDMMQLSMEKCVRSKILRSLKELFEGLTLNEIDMTAYSKNIAPRTLLVPIEFPSFEHFFDVSLTQKQKTEYIAVTDPIKFTLSVRNLSTIWKQGNNDGEFNVNIVRSNKWLVHGKKSTKFNGEDLNIDLVLIPLERGHLLLPKIEVTDNMGEIMKFDNSSMNDIILVL